MRLQTLPFTLLSLFGALGLSHLSHASNDLDPAEIKELTIKVADWHLENPVEWLGIRWWHQAPYYNGLIAAAQATGEAKYLAKVIDYGERSGWALADRTYHADDHAVGQAWLDIYNMNPKRSDRLNPTKEVLDYVVDHPILERRHFGEPGNSNPVDRWIWCDALYMSPPTLARLAQITGNQKYLRFMDLEYRLTYDELWDPDEKLFYRDMRFPGARTKNGKKIFWSRGNGWVYGGLVQILSVLPESDIAYPFYQNLFIELSEGIASAQQTDGLWRPNLRDPEQVEQGEASGTGFFIYGMAWGISHGLLDETIYRPILKKGWSGLKTLIQENGMVGYVQPVGFKPEDGITKDDTQAYGAGSVLLAGSEILKMLDSASDKSTANLYAEANALLKSGLFARKDGTYVVPKRADDVAWENDKIAFRVYGPALRESTENSGIDVWVKSVTRPIVKDWYETEFAGEGSYHINTGEGYDAFKVGASRGCGGTGIWHNGEFYTANVYKTASVLDTKPGEVSLEFKYEYDIEGMKLTEYKSITLKLGSYLCEAKSVFKGNKELIDSLRISVGLLPQSKDAKFVKSGNSIALWDQLDETWLATGARLLDGFEKGSVVATRKGTDLGDALITAKLVDNELSYLFGFSWEKHSEFTNVDSWLNYIDSY